MDLNLRALFTMGYGAFQWHGDLNSVQFLSAIDLSLH